MKLKKILNNFDKYQYIIGGLFSFMYQYKNGNFLFVSYSKIQKTNQNLNFKKYYDIYKNKLTKKFNLNFYDISLLKNKKTKNSLGTKNQVGIYLEIENDIKISAKELFSKIYLIAIEKQEISDFVRGMWEVTASVDVKYNFLTRDINKSLGEQAPYYFYKLSKKVVHISIININPRYKQPSDVSKSKNTQFRFKLSDYLTILGTRRNVIKEILEINKNKNKYFNKFKKIKYKLKDDIYYYDFWEKIKYSIVGEPRKLLDSLNDYKADDLHKKHGIKNREYIKEILTIKEPKIENEKIRREIPKDTKEKLIKSSKFVDELTKKKLLLKDKKYESSEDNCIFDFHHIIPFAYRKFLMNFSKKEKLENVIHDPRNVIILKPETHAILHRSNRKEILEYLQIMWKRVESLVKENGDLITFKEFKLMY